MSTELVEVHENPRGGVTLTNKEYTKMVAMQARHKAEPKKKKGKGGKKKSKKLDVNSVAMGAAAGGLIEMYLVRGESGDKLPPMVKKYSGAIMAGVGYIAATSKKGKASTKAMGVGLMAAGIMVAIEDERIRQVAKTDSDRLQKVIKKAFADMGVEGVGGLGDYPRPPYMTAEQAAASLGVQNKLPYQPYGTPYNGMGELVHTGGMGELLHVNAPQDRADNPALGSLVEAHHADEWVNEMFPRTGSPDYREEEW